MKRILFNLTWNNLKDMFSMTNFSYISYNGIAGVTCTIFTFRCMSCGIIAALCKKGKSLSESIGWNKSYCICLIRRITYARLFDTQSVYQYSLSFRVPRAVSISSNHRILSPTVKSNVTCSKPPSRVNALSDYSYPIPVTKQPSHAFSVHQHLALIPSSFPLHPSAILVVPKNPQNTAMRVRESIGMLRRAPPTTFARPGRIVYLETRFHRTI